MFNEHTYTISQFLSGYFSGDGSFSFRNNNPILKIDSCNKEMLKGIRELLLLNGIACSYNEENKVTSYMGVKSKYKMQRINILDKYKFMEIIGFKTSIQNKFNSNFTKFNKENRSADFKLRRIQRVEKIKSSCYVYDFQIKGNERFYANDFLVHNTDSLFLKDGQMIPNSLELGEFKYEGTEKSCIFVKPKFYAKESKAKIKGIKTIKTREKFEKFIGKLDKDGYASVKEDQFLRFAGVIKANKPHHKIYGKRINAIIEREKKVRLEDDKRKWSRKKFDATILQDSEPIELK
jgi:hypothetical protein